MFTSMAVLFRTQLRVLRDLLHRRPLLSAALPRKPLSRDLVASDGSRTCRSNTSSVEVAPLRLIDCRPNNWDAFAQDCGASFQSAHGWLWGWSLKTRFQQRLKTFEFYEFGQKIGQCAIGVSAGKSVFLDRLALKPGCELRWADCMAALLMCQGPGQYRYGWNLSLEQSRKEHLQNIPGVTVESVRPLVVQAVDFRRWASWDAYWASTSSNTRRNAKRGENNNLRIVVRTGIACMLDVVAIDRLRSTMYKRKGIEFDRVRAQASFVGGHLLAPQYRLAAIVSEGREPLAGFIGYEFGTHTYYLAGGSRRFNNGAAWYLQKQMLQRAWDRSGGCAKFIVGYVDYTKHDEAVGGGLLRSRRSVNTSDFETSIVTFQYEVP